MNKNIIIAILIVIIIAAGAALFFNQQPLGKTNTQIDISDKGTFQLGEQVQFQLKDAQGNALSGKTVNFTFNNQKYTITTDQSGKGYMTIFGIDSGQYTLEINYAGDDKYNGCDAKATITVDAESDADNPAQQTDGAATVSTDDDSGSSGGNNGGDPGSNPGGSDSDWTYIDSLGVYVNSNGIIVATNGDDLPVGMTVAEYKDWLYKVNHEDTPDYNNTYDDYSSDQ